MQGFTLKVLLPAFSQILGCFTTAMQHMKVKDLIPKGMKIRYQLLKRLIKHTFIDKYNFATRKDNIRTHPDSVSLKQDIKKSYLYENKIHNLKVASSRVSNIIIMPGEVLSFWRSVKAPTPENDYRIGRNIISGQMKEDYGGGLCQLSGLIHHIALLVGLEIIERHNHSVDFYTDESRYAPIGTDATVVYGYKDLMIKNNKEYPLSFDFGFIKNDQIVAYILSEAKIQMLEIDTKISVTEGEKTVQLVKKSGCIISESTYRIF